MTDHRMASYDELRAAGLDDDKIDALEAGAVVGAQLVDLPRPAPNGNGKAEHFSSRGERATPQHPEGAPSLACEQRIIDLFRSEVRSRGLVGEDHNAAVIYLVMTSRLLDRQVSVGVKGHSSSGKSHIVETVVDFFPPDAVIVFTAMSEKALVYSNRDFRHRTLIIYELTGLRENVEDDLTSYFIRTLLSERRIDYEVTVKTKDGTFTTKRIVKEGPCNLVFTTTKTRVHAENETRVLSLHTDDSSAQTRRVFLEIAKEDGGGADLTEWRNLQQWLAGANHKVTIPYARTLAESIPPKAVRLRRDFGSLLALIRAHAMLHQQTRDRDEQDRIIATVDDYRIVGELVGDTIAAGIAATVPPTVRETVDAVAALKSDEGVRILPIAARLGIDKSNASRRLRSAADDGYVVNLEDRRGKPARWVLGEPLPDDIDLLPDPQTLGCCGVARAPGEKESEDLEAWSGDGLDEEVIT